MSILEKFLQSIQNYHGGTLFLVANIVVMVSVLVLFAAILIDFIEFHHRNNVKKRVRSWVETGSMFGYYVVYYLLIKIGFTYFHLHQGTLRNVFVILGTIIVALGCYVNVKGRLDLQHNWANQVTIYDNHTLVGTGMYRFIRHPLYASIIWMLLGGSFVYANFIALLSVVFIFIPMMYYRARQEEQLLSLEFPEYTDYKKRVGMFFPKLVYNG